MTIEEIDLEIARIDEKIKRIDSLIRFIDISIYLLLGAAVVGIGVVFITLCVK